MAPPGYSTAGIGLGLKNTPFYFKLILKICGMGFSFFDYTPYGKAPKSLSYLATHLLYDYDIFLRPTSKPSVLNSFNHLVVVSGSSLERHKLILLLLRQVTRT